MIRQLVQFNTYTSTFGPANATNLLKHLVEKTNSKKVLWVAYG